MNDCIGRRVDESLADPRPDIPAEEVFAGLRRHHAAHLTHNREEQA